ncbi:MAG: glucans biosynthesis glucosyltransferase MdoH [Hyphomicrobiales bacterium]|nr:glucans biosynthesis glucosyltransferase MdoH [Hyphomicrobiales bacterium]MBV8827463.1 glucans biosynthesis glucosyltransferase MdoH [Hyphomicrobiales bacterium]
MDAVRDAEDLWHPPLPPEAPLVMPVQSLGTGRRARERPPTSPRGIGLRRAALIAATVALTALAAYQMYLVFAAGALTVLEALVLALFVVLFAWVAFSFCTACIGFVALMFGGGRTLGIDLEAPPPALSTRTALLAPTYNEDPVRLTARIEAMVGALSDVGVMPHFDVFILSDTLDPDIWIAEEAAFLRLRARTGADAQIFYRHRASNEGRKAGNIGEWVRRFGGGYQQMIVLDADSLMSGATIVQLAAAMERHPRVGIIQTLPTIVGGRTLFARLQQFAGRVYGPLIGYGLAWWFGADGNYWGHNAAIRVAAFAAAAGLPPLRGPKPFGGTILSHDFIEAALMRRAGWAVHMAPALGGSFEEAPPSLTDHAIRDRRWCQGNLQHIAVLPARGLHWVSRLHLMIGIGAYLTAPMWLLFLILGLLISLQAHFIRPEYFPRGFALFPQWPVVDPVRAAYVFAGTFGLLLLPKLLGLLALASERDTRRGAGGAARACAGVLIETLISGLMAPVLMSMQSRAVAQILRGRDAGWHAQRRDDGTLPLREIVRGYLGQTALGVALAAAAYAISLPLLWWMSPVILGLLLAVPLAALTARPDRGLRALGLLAIPEERDPPEIVARANHLLAARATAERDDEAVSLLSGDPALLDLHRSMLTERERRRGDIEVDLVVALAKLEETTTVAEALEVLTPREKMALLSSRRGVDALMARASNSPSS